MSRLSFVDIMIFRKIGAFVLDTIQVVVFAIAIFLFIYLLVLQPHKIKGNSMQPNFPDGEYLLTDKVTYRFREPQRGDVIVFEPPSSDGEEFIKRIIGLPGDEVSVTGGQVHINGVTLQEPYIAVETNAGIFLKDGMKVVVPEDNYFVLGDNRPHSSDSRAWGFVTKDKITGRGWVVYWPADSAGKIDLPQYNI